MTSRWVEDTEGRREFPVWTRAHAAGLFPNPIQPLDADLLLSETAMPAWRLELLGRLGFGFDEVPEGSSNLLGIFDGNVYLNASLVRVWAARTPAIAPDHIDHAFFASDPPPFEQQLWHDRSTATEVLHHWLRWVLVDPSSAEVAPLVRHAELVRRRRPCFDDMLDDAVYGRVNELKAILKRLGGHYLNHLLAASVGPGIIRAICSGMGLPTEVPRLLAGVGGLESVASLQAMWTLSRLVSGSATATAIFDAGPDGLEQRLRASSSTDVQGLMAGIDALVGAVGPIGAASWELCLDPGCDEVNEVLDAIDWLRRCDGELDPGMAQARTVAERALMIDEIGGLVAHRSSSLGREQFLAAVRATETFLRNRELVHRAMTLMRVEIRAVLRELGERATQRQDIDRPDDLRLLFDDELAYYADGGLATIGDLVAGRRARLGQVPTDPIDLIDMRSPRAVPSSEPAMLEAGALIIGRSVSAATGTGPVRLMTGQDRPVEPGCVLVAETGSTAWLPRLVGAAAVVVESGTLIGHLAILCRELGVALVVGTAGVTKRLAEGAVVEVDGLTGIVTVVEDPPHTAANQPALTLDPWGAA